MKQEQLEHLTAKYLAGTATLEEQRLLNDWYHSFDDSEVIVPADNENEKAETHQRILLALRSRIERDQRNFRTPKRQTPAWLKIAAAVILIMSATFVVYNYKPTEKEPVAIALIEKATLAGQKSKITLSDGTVIHMNSESSIRFPERFSGNNREVTLTGEAFFDVARDESRPFIITSGKVTTTVLGTSFNIKAYSGDQNIEVIVATGQVRVEGASGLRSSDSGLPSSVLTPNQAAIYNTLSGELITHQVDASQQIAWKDGWLIFEEKELQEVTKTLERWYGTTIVIEDEDLKKMKVTLKQQDESLTSVMKILSFLAGFDYKIEKDKITITKK